MNRDWPVIHKCFITNLSGITTLIRARYHDKGPEPIVPASLLRSYLLFLLVRSLEFSQRFTLGTVGKMLLDAAHDAEAIYDMLQQQGVIPFIDLNKREKKPTETGTGINISADGVPICPAGNKMKPNGYDNTQNRQKWRRSLICKGENTCAKPCSTAKYGRTFHTFNKDNLQTCRQSEA